MVYYSSQNISMVYWNFIERLFNEEHKSTILIE
jgi:hypothetical protein